jgi:hypothetical protein
VPRNLISEKKLDRLFDPFSPITVKYKDIFNFKDYYTALKFWLNEYGWEDGVEDSPKNEWFETYYNERVDPAGSREMRIRWHLTKPAPGNAKLQYHLDMQFHVLALTNTEVIRDGQKIKTNKGECELKINAAIEKKYEDELEKSGILKPFKKLFTNRVYNTILDEKKKELYQEIYIFQNFIKQWLKLKRYLPYEEVKVFHPSQAFPSHQKDK